MEDILLVKQFQSGQTESFGQLYDKYINKIYNFIYFRTHHQQTAEDITSLVFTKVLEKISSFNTQTGTFQAWLYRIAKNTVIDHYRTKKVTSELESILDLGLTDKEIENIDSKDKLAKVIELLKDLTSEQRDIVVMRVWDGLSYREIGEILGKSEDSCKVMFSRTIKKIREHQGLVLLLLLLDRLV